MELHSARRWSHRESPHQRRASASCPWFVTSAGQEEDPNHNVECLYNPKNTPNAKCPDQSDQFQRTEQRVFQKEVLAGEGSPCCSWPVLKRAGGVCALEEGRARPITLILSEPKNFTWRPREREARSCGRYCQIWEGGDESKPLVVPFFATEHLLCLFKSYEAGSPLYRPTVYVKRRERR